MHSLHSLDGLQFRTEWDKLNLSVGQVHGLTAVPAANNCGVAWSGSLLR